MTKAKSTRPKPPEDLEGEALLEWERICDELATADRLDTADRAVIALLARTHAQYMQSLRLMGEDIVIQYGGNPGQSPYFKTAKELAVLIRALLNDLGLTPVARAKTKATDAGPPPLDF